MGKHLHPDIELFPLELAGRGDRINIALYHTLKEAVKDAG
jgi:surfactin synthase thioesterase subunit